MDLSLLVLAAVPAALDQNDEVLNEMPHLIGLPGHFLRSRCAFAGMTIRP
jgi:hypothetical protein